MSRLISKIYKPCMFIIPSVASVAYICYKKDTIFKRQPTFDSYKYGTSSFNDYKYIHIKDNVKRTFYTKNIYHGLVYSYESPIERYDEYMLDNKIYRCITSNNEMIVNILYEYDEYKFGGVHDLDDIVYQISEGAVTPVKSKNLSKFHIYTEDANKHREMLKSKLH